MADVFVSYKAEDRGRIQPLVDALQADGLSVWWDAHIGGGADWRETIAHELDAARCVIVVWSKRSIGSDGRFVRDEATRALKRGAYLPARIDKVDPPLGFGESQALPLTGWKGDRSDPRYGAILAAARTMIGIEPGTAVRPSRRRGVDRRALIAGGAALTAAAGVGGWFALRGGGAASDSIAVLPFANLSGDPAQAYFSDGMAEELRSALSRIAGLTVVARTSSEMLRDADAKTAARKLGVAHILSGSVRRSPSTVRVSAQLIDGENGMERWSESFDRPSGDVLHIQTGIAESVAQALSIRLAGADRAALSLGGTRNPAAQDLLLQARQARLGDSKPGIQEALALLDAAIKIDPNFAEAHALRAVRLNILSSNYSLSAAEGQRGLAQALASANRAIAIAPRMALGYGSRAGVLTNQLNLGAALADYVKAEALPGSGAATSRSYAALLAQSRRADEAWRMIIKARSLDPLNPLNLETESFVLYDAGRYAEATAAARRALQLAPTRRRVRAFLAHALLALGKSAEAETEYRKLEPTDHRRILGLAVLAARAGNRNSAMTYLREMERRFGDFAHYQYGQIYAQIGAPNEAFKALELALEARDPGMSGLRVDPFLEPLRRDQRFALLERKLNFP